MFSAGFGWYDVSVVSLIGALSISLHFKGRRKQPSCWFGRHLPSQIPCLLEGPPGEASWTPWARDQEPLLGSFPTHCAGWALSLDRPGKEARRKPVPPLVQNVPVWLESLRSGLGEKNKTSLTEFSAGQVWFTSAF